MTKSPRVLVISHNPFSDLQNNGKTLASFFKGWKKDSLRQIFFTLDEYSTSVCKSFFRISDVDVLRCFIGKRKKCGMIINSCNIEKYKDSKKHYDHNIFYQSMKKLFQKKVPIIWLARCIAWKKVKPWKTEEMKKWIREFSPDVIFFQTSNFYVIYDMVLDIKKMTGAKLILETTDDYVTPHFTLSPINIYKNKKMEKTYAKTVKESDYVVVIGEDMKEEYSRRFGGNYEIAMNSVDTNSNTEEKINDSFHFLYSGNIGLNRWKTLCMLGEILDDIQNDYHTLQINLDICSLMQPSKRVLRRFENIKSIHFLGALNQKQLQLLKKNSNVLVHVEAFDKKNIAITRLSVSTKIPEYMLSNRCILALGPENVASIRYLEKYNIGMVLTNKNRDVWKSEIKDLINNQKKRDSYVSNAIKYGKLNHDHKANQETIKRIINTCVKRCEK